MIIKNSSTVKKKPQSDKLGPYDPHSEICSILQIGKYAIRTKLLGWAKRMWLGATYGPIGCS